MKTELRKYPRVQQEPGGPSLTQQQFKDQVDVNKIVEKFQRTGVAAGFRQDQPMYGDFSQIQDFRGNLQKMEDALDSFMKLPPQLRARFENDPAQLVEWVQNPSNQEEAIKLGLMSKKAEISQPASNDDKTTKNASPDSAPTQAAPKA